MSASSRTCGTRPTRPSTTPAPRPTCEETGGRAPPVSLPATSSGSPVPHRRDPSRPSGSSPSGTPHFPGPTVRSVCHRCHCRKGQVDPDLGAVSPQGCGPSSLPYVVALNPFVATILNRKSKSSRGACDVPPGRSRPPDWQALPGRIRVYDREADEEGRPLPAWGGSPGSRPIVPTHLGPTCSGTPSGPSSCAAGWTS